jgi:hypothetical protein
MHKALASQNMSAKPCLHMLCVVQYVLLQLQGQHDASGYICK